MFVQFFRQASAYIEGHRGRTFVLAIPPEVEALTPLLHSILEDVALLHGLGVRLVLVVGSTPCSSEPRGTASSTHPGHVDDEALERVIAAAGLMRMQVESRLRRSLGAGLVRRHLQHGETAASLWDAAPRASAGFVEGHRGAATAGVVHHPGALPTSYPPLFSWPPASSGLSPHPPHSLAAHLPHAEPEAGGVPTVSGNWVAARRLGILGGLDRGHAGAVRFVAAKSLVRQLDAGCLVLLDALGYSSGGEVLACDVYAVAARAAVDLRADKLVIWTLPVIMRGLRVGGARDERAGVLPEGEGGLETDVEEERGGNRDAHSTPESALEPAPPSPPPLVRACSKSLPAWVPVDEAASLLVSMLPDPALAAQLAEDLGVTTLGGDACQGAQGTRSSQSASQPRRQHSLLELERWSAAAAASSASPDKPSDRPRQFLPLPLLCAAAACKAGVRRTHLVEASSAGGVLLELYSRDGAPQGTLVSADAYQGIRRAQGAKDVAALRALLRPLEDRGFLVRRSEADLLRDLPCFALWEREGHVLGCVCVKALGASPRDGLPVAELGAFAVHAAHRGQGAGDALLAVAQDAAREEGARRLILLTTRAAEWFQLRGFEPAGDAHRSDLLPLHRRGAIDASRGAKLYVKELEE